jgi:phosphogluconate dehydratase
MNKVLNDVTARIVERSAATREHYLDRTEAARRDGVNRTSLSCSNLAHGIAACGKEQKDQLVNDVTPNIAIITAYNDMLSAHQPYERYPALIRQVAGEMGAVAQVAGGVPAMCDGITQGEDGMDLSLFSRDVIAMSTAIALSHNMFDAALCLGICDKIVPGLMIGALSFGHLPVLFVPAGPMPSGLPNKKKAEVREAYAAGEVDRSELIAAESASYHSPGTCTFYGTANSNQMLMEFMGMQLPGGSFVNPEDDMRDHLTRAAVQRSLELTNIGNHYLPVSRVIDEKSIVNGIVGLLATGGSTNHTIHLIAIAGAAGIKIDWKDFADLSNVIPLLAQVYPNGMADVNHFHAAGGLGFVIGELIDAGLLHEDVQTIAGPGLGHYRRAPTLENGDLRWQPTPKVPGDKSVLRCITDPFQPEGGIKVVEGEIGRAIVKVSAVEASRRCVTAPARVFSTQQEFLDAFDAGQLECDFVAVVLNQGPGANGMPE